MPAPESKSEFKPTAPAPVPAAPITPAPVAPAQAVAAVQLPTLIDIYYEETALVPDPAAAPQPFDYREPTRGMVPGKVVRVRSAQAYFVEDGTPFGTARPLDGTAPLPYGPGKPGHWGRPR